MHNIILGCPHSFVDPPRWKTHVHARLKKGEAQYPEWKKTCFPQPQRWLLFKKKLEFERKNTTMSYSCQISQDVFYISLLSPPVSCILLPPLQEFIRVTSNHQPNPEKNYHTSVDAATSPASTSVGAKVVTSPCQFGDGKDGREKKVLHRGHQKGCF